MNKDIINPIPTITSTIFQICLPSAILINGWNNNQREKRKELVGKIIADGKEDALMDMFKGCGATF